MNQPRDIERLLDQWFADGSSVAPDRVIDIVADRIERQPQRPAWRLDWRHLTMSTTYKLAGAVAAVAIVGVIGYSLLPGSSTGGGGPAPSVTPSATPTAAPSARPLTGDRLAAGTYSTKPFTGDAAGITVTLTVPDGWSGAESFAISSPTFDAPSGSGVVFLQATGPFDDPCRWDKAGTGHYAEASGKVVGPSVDDLVDAIRANKSFTSSAPVDITVDGYAGKQVDIQLPSDIDFKSCDKETGDADGQYYPLAGGWGFYAQGPGNRWHLRVFDVDGSRLIAAVIDYAQTPADVQAEAQAIIDSIQISK